ncbi:MAG TPA: hypothetical protein VLF18_09620 [Tahibacter sp.]|uniref:hypothetical protein n=1 Tax=Tahibacter sp. TaxID=2056211 RepID=UPI002B55318D|nr:hypothetical protein [Tahibacter sp.]HSX60443.1 hypothetical protein [Tahibacter sp.]
MSCARLAVLSLLAALILSPGHLLARESSQPIVDAARQERFADQAAAIRQEMKPGGRFEYVNAQERQEVDAQLDRIAALLDKRDGERLGDNDQLDLLAAQETANAILTQRDGRRLICDWTAPTGSNRKIKQCITYADRMGAHKETRRMMMDNLRKSPAESCYDPAKC